MKRYLRIIDSSKKPVLNEELGALILDRGRVIIPTIDLGTEGMYVEDSKYNQKILGEEGYSFLGGTLESIDGNLRFFETTPHKTMQLMLGDLEAIELKEEKFGVPMEQVWENSSKYLPIFCDIISENLSNKYGKLIAIPNNSRVNNVHTFNVYQVVIGFVKKVYLVHQRFGVSKISLRKDFTDNSLKLVFESMYDIAYLGKNKNLDRFVK